MFNFNDQKNKKVFVRIIVIVLCLAMILPTAYYLFTALLG